MRVSAICTFIGREFNPFELEKESTLVLERKQLKGDISFKGRHKGKQVPNGSAVIVIETEQDPLSTILNLLWENYNVISKSHIDQIFLTLNIGYSDQCNWEVKNEQIRKIAEMGLDFAFSCFLDEETKAKEISSN